MSRIACLYVPNLYFQAHRRLEPHLESTCMAWVEGGELCGRVVGVSPLAARAGIAAGMTTTQARAVCDTVTTRRVSCEALRSAMTALGDVAGAMSSRVEIDARNLVFLDCTGGARLWASERELANVLVARSERCGLRTWVGIADSKLGALVAARTSGGARIVPRGCTREFLSPFPIAVLDVDSETAVMLVGWGVRSIRQLAAIPEGALAHRLGPIGVRLARCARGEDESPLDPRPTPDCFEEGLALDYGVDRQEPLMFVIRRLIECVLKRLALYGFVCRDLSLDFELEGGRRNVRSIRLAAPTTETKSFVALVRSHLEACPLLRPVMKVVVSGRALRGHPAQLDLLKPVGPAPTTLASMLARLEALCGSGRVGILQRSASHRPDGVEVGPFVGCDDAARCLEVPAPVSPDDRAVMRMALRAFRPPVILEVFESRSRPDYVRGRGFGGRVVHAGGPWRVRGEWWTDDPYAREYYDLELSDGGIYRVYRDVRRHCWLADGVYD